MIAAWIQLAVALGAGAADDTRFCEVPADCKADEACVAFLCQRGSDRARVARLYKIAVAPPVVARPDRVSRAAAKRLYAQILSDLRWSGFYEVVGEEGLPAGWRLEGASTSEVRRPIWQEQGLYRTVKIAMAPAAGGRLRVRIHAIDVERFGFLALPEGEVTVAPGEMRALAARWVNALIGADTGVAGAAGSRIVGATQVAPGVKEIAVIDVHGEGYRRVTDDENLNLGPAWGPGGKIGWMSYRSGNPDWVVDGEPLSTRPGLNAAGAWSPDGKYLALSVAEGGDSELVLLEAQTGAEYARLTDDRAVDTSPAWSPDGKRMAFVSDRSGRPQIWILSLQGGPLVQLTAEGYNTSPTWSPLGDTIVYARQGGGGNFSLMRHDLDTGQTRRLTDGAKSAESPTFSPDGRYIAYALKGEGGSRLWIMHADGRGARAVDPDDRSFFSPDWER
ncbi:MAG: hypothetical protein CSA66_05475 [Proteobacteria bacterium]|nr:MAG: hypothetical protein CSA66_05475 [Pseudomonadota bacterium]